LIDPPYCESHHCLMNFHERHSILKPLAFGIASIFVYGGSVNYGGFDFLPAAPYLLFVLYAALKWRRSYATACVLLVLVCVPLYVLKWKHGPLFHPALGKEMKTNEDTCLTLFKISKEEFVLMSEIRENKCDSSHMGDAVRWEVLPKGAKLTVDRVSVSNADFGESYVIHSKVALGDISLYPSNQKALYWLNGKGVEQSDLRRGIFYYPSLLMYWPMAPVMIRSILLSLFK
jgi:hypothetical protein